MNDQKMCPASAQFAVPWAGKIYICCETHARALKAIGEHIGAPVEVRPIVTVEHCYSVDDLAEFEKAKK